MRNRRRQLVAVLVLVALAFITLDFREEGGPVGTLQRGTDAVFAPVQGGFAAVVRPIGNFFGSIFEIGTLRSRIEGLEADNAELRAESLVQADLERRLREAEELLRMSREQNAQLVGARVIAAPPGTFERSIVIDVGASQGVAPAMAVVNSRGVVGIVVEVTATRARVNLLSSTEAGLGVRVAQTGDWATLSGQGSGLLSMQMLNSGAIVPDDAVITTQAFQGSLIPSGLPVGVLEPPPGGDTRGEQSLDVRPYVDFGSLSTVAVVVAGREVDGEFSDEEIIRMDGLVPAPTVTRQPGADVPTPPPTGQPSPAATGE